MNNEGKIEFQIAIDNKSLRNGVNQSRREFQNLANYATTQGRKIDSEFQSMGSSIKSGISSMVGGIKTSILDLTKSMLGLSAVMSSGAFLKTLYDDAKAFSRQMKIVSTISEEVTNDLNGFKQKVLDICSQISVAPATAADALYQINSAGHLGAAGLQVLEASAKAAVAGVTETSIAADAITTVLNAYGLSAEHATDISDKLFTTVRLGKTTMAELGHSISTVAPVAATFGVSIDEVLGVVSELTKQGVNTATAMTQIRSAITAVTESLGDGAFKTRSLLEAFEEVNAKSKGSENALKTDLGNIRALQAVLMATGKHASETADFIDEIANSTGATETAFRKMNSTAGAQLTILRNNFLKEFQEMGDSMTANLGGIAKSLNEAFDSGVMKVVLSLLKDLIIAYGVYKVTVMAQSGINTMMYNQQMAQMQAIIAEKTAEMDADIKEALAKGKLTQARAAELQAIRMEVEAKIASLTATVEATRIEAEAALRKRMAAQVEVQSIQAEIAARDEEIAACEAYGFQQTAETLRTERDTLQKKLNTAQGKLHILTRMEAVKAEKAAAAAQALETAKTQRDTAIKQQNAVATTLLTKVTKGLRKAIDAVKDAIAKNPLGMFMLAATMAIGVLTSFSDSMDEASEASTRFGEEAAKSMSNIDTLTAVIKATSEKSKVHKDAVDELIKIYNDYGIKIDETLDVTQQLIDKKDQLIAKIREEGEETRKANLLASYQEAIDKAIEGTKKQLEEGFKNAEIDGSGTFDDWDFKAFQDNWQQMSIVVSSIMQSKAEEMAGLSGKAYEEAMNNAIEEVYRSLRETYGFKYGEERTSDINFRNILAELIEKTEGLREQRDNLADSMDRGKKSTLDDAEALDYSKMAFDQLYEAVYKTDKQIDNLGNKEVKPDIDSSSIDEATEKTTGLLGMLNNFFGTTFTIPTINFNWEDMPIIGTFIKQENDKQEKSAADALEQQIVNAMTTRKGTADLLKKVNEMLDEAVTGSTDEKRLLAIQKRLQDQKTAFDKMSGKGKKSGGKTAAEIASDVEKAQLETDRIIEESYKQREQLMLTLANDLSQLEINLQRDASKRKLAQLDLDQKKEAEKLDQQLEDAIKAEIDRQKRFFDAKEKEKKAANQHYAVRNFTRDDIDQDEIDRIIEEYRKLAEATENLHRKQREDIIREELSDLNSYIRDYGSYEARKLALHKEYEQQMLDATTEAQKKRLQAELDEKLRQLEYEKFKESIDWSSIFSDMEHSSISSLKSVREQLREMLKDEKLTADQAKELVEAFEKIDSALSDKEAENSIFGINRLRSERLRREQEAENARDIERDAKVQQQNARVQAEFSAQVLREALQKAGYTGELENLQATQAADIMAQFGDNMPLEESQKLLSLFGDLAEAERILAESTKKADDATRDRERKEDKAKGPETTIGKLKASVAEFGATMELIGGYVDGATQLIDTLGLANTGFGKAVSNIAEGVNSATSACSKFAQGDYLGALADGISSLKSLGAALGIGGDSDKHYERDMARLAETNEALEKAIEKLTKVMEDASVADASDLYKKQIKLLDEEIANKQEQMMRSGKAYSNGVLGIGGSHSSNTKINNGMSSADWSRINQALRSAGFSTRVNGASDFWKLSPEEMRAVLENAPVQFAKIKELADDGYKDAAQFMDDYLGFAEQREELEKAYREKLTSFSFDSIRDEFKSCLTDMSKSAADFSSDFNKMLIDSISEALMTEKYDPMIKALYEKWAKLMEDGELSDSDVAELQREKDAIFNSMKDDREFLKSLSTSGGAQQSSSKGFAAASQDSIDELNGRFTAIQIDTSVIRTTLSEIGASINAQAVSLSEQRQAMNEILNISLQALEYLSAISKNTHELYDINDKLTKIVKNTKNA